MKALELSPGNWAAVDRGVEAAWSWIDCNTDEGRIGPDPRNRMRDAPSMARVALGGPQCGRRVMRSHCADCSRAPASTAGWCRLRLFQYD